MKWWFGRKSASQPSVPVWAAARGEGFPRSYEAQVREIFVANPVGARCLRLVCGAVGNLTVYGEDETFLPLLRGGELIERLAMGVILNGNAYGQLLVDDREMPSEIAVLRPERVAILADAAGQAEAIAYRAGGKAVRVAMRDALYRRRVVHVRGLNPGDDHYGQGCLDAAIGAASVHNRATRWNKALLDNSARPSGALTYAPGDGANLSREQFARLRGELDEMFSGDANAGRPMLLDGGLQWQAMAMSPSDMDFVALKESAARDIALAFGVPPVLIGLPGDATYANAREAGRALYRQTVLPLARAVLRALDEMLADWGPRPGFAIDEDGLSELAGDREALWAQVGAADFLTLDEKRAQLGFGPAPKGE